MEGPRAHIRVGACDVTVIGTVSGAVADGDRVAAAIDASPPEAIALGIPEEDLEPLASLVADPSLAEELPEIEGAEEVYLAALAQFGDVLIAPSPDLAAAQRTGLPLHAIDLSDEVHTELFTKTVKVRHLVQRASHRNKAEKTDWTTTTDRFDLARKWDAALSRSKPLRRLEEAREQHMADRIKELAHDHASLLAVVPAARFDGVVASLE